MGKHRNQKPKKHDCGYAHSAANKGEQRPVVEFELCMKRKPVKRQDRIIPSGQFVPREQAVQVDRREIA